MKNKYLNKFFCITMLSAMVLAIPTGVKAAEEADNVVAEEGVSGDGSEVSEPEPEVPAEPEPTAAPEPEITAAPDPEPTTYLQTGFRDGLQYISRNIWDYTHDLMQ